MMTMRRSGQGVLGATLTTILSIALIGAPAGEAVTAAPAIASSSTSTSASVHAPTFVAPSEVPQFVWRIDKRSPAEITQAGGFKPRGRNVNLADHVIAGKDPATGSVFVSTTSNKDVAHYLQSDWNWDDAWLYRVESDFTTYSVASSVNAALEQHPSWYKEWQQRSNYRFKRFVEEQEEWVAANGIELERVHSAEKWSLVRDRQAGTVQLREAVGERWSNSAFTPRTEAERAALDPFPIEKVTECRTRSLCTVRRPTEAELTDEHADRLTGNSEEIDLTLRPEDLLSDPDAIVAPMPDSIGVVDDYAEHSFTPSTLDSFGAELSEAFSSDFAGLDRLTSSEGVLEPVAEAAGRVVNIGSELIPYIGISATGYALAEDVEAGRWGDAAADAVVEGLQILEVAQPELTPLLEPAVIVVTVIQLIADNFWDWTHPKPAVSPEQEGHIARANDAADEVVPKSLEVWDRERAALAQRFIGDHAADGLAQDLAAKAREDLAMIRTSYQAAAAELGSARLRTLHRSEDKEAISASYDRASTRLRAAAYEQQRQRLDQYRDRLPELLEALGDEFWEHADLSAARERFVQDRLAPYAHDATRLVWEAVTETPEEDWFRKFGGAWVHNTFLDRTAWESNVTSMFTRIDEVRPAPSGGFLPDVTSLADRFEPVFLDAVAPARMVPAPGTVHISSAVWQPDGIHIRGEAEPGREVKSTNDPKAGWYSFETGAVRAGADGTFSGHTRRNVDERAVVKAFGAGYPVSESVVPEPRIVRAQRNADGSITIEGYAAPRSDIRTTNDPQAGWFPIESGSVRADSKGHFLVHTGRSVDGHAVIRAFGKESPVSNRVRLS